MLEGNADEVSRGLGDGLNEGEARSEQVDVGVYSRTTIIPLREEFRLRRLWFFYHDVRAFTTSVRLHNRVIIAFCVYTVWI